MARLYYIDKDGQEQVIEMTLKSKPVLVGRNPACAVVTANASVSRMHAKLFVKDGEYLLEDIGSANGTTVGGERIRGTHALSDSTFFICGAYPLRFEMTPEEGGSEAGAKEAMAGMAAAVAGKGGAQSKDDAPPKEAEAAPDRAKAAAEQKAALDRKRAERDRRMKEAHQGEAAAAPKAAPKEKAAPATVTRGKGKPKEAAKPREAAKPKAAAEPKEAPAQKKAAKPKAAAGDVAAQVKGRAEAEQRAAEAEARAKDAEASVEALERKLADVQTKNTRLTIEMDGLTEKYVKMKDQVQLNQSLVEDLRYEKERYDERMGDATTKAQRLEQELEQGRDKANKDAAIAADFKIKITQRDRELSELQRKLDILEYELKETQEENQALQESFNQGGSSSEMLETRLNQLREVIEEKDQAIEQLQHDLKGRDEEIERLRIGVGIADLEEEKRRLLNDFYEKNKDLEALQAQLDASGQRGQATSQENAELKAQLKELENIASHPQFPEVKAHVEKMAEEMRRQQKELAEARRLYSPEDKEALEQEISDLRRGKRRLERQLEDLGDEKTALYESVKRMDALIDAATKGEDALVQTEANVAMLKNYMGDIEKKRKADARQEVLILTKDLVKVMEDDIKQARAALDKVIKG
jgi:chromosome segregation ATPase